MKISIIGPSASGKTTLAKKISDLYQLEHTDLDYVCFKFIKPRKRIKLKRCVYMKKIKKIIEKHNWVIEGINPIHEVFEKAGIIIWLRPNFFKALYRQWKRYLTDSCQRCEHGFINNLKLSRYIFRQYFENPTPVTDPKKTWIKSAERELDTFKTKLYIIDYPEKEKQMFVKLKELNN